ncbi:MAG: four helix bundle protein, partial [Bacillota bacterium]|nr:four helix bundle protein [Bacillota bacterium]
ARGSACELEYQLILARDLGYLDKEKTDELLGKLREILRMLNGLINTLKNLKEPVICDLRSKLKFQGF